MRTALSTLILTAPLGIAPLSAQVVVTDMTHTSTTAQSLANALAGPGVSIVSGSASLIQTSDPLGSSPLAPLSAAGTFTDVSSVLGFANGVILSSGAATGISGTAPNYNTAPNITGDLNLLGYPTLLSAYGDGDPSHDFHDSTVLQFSFVPTTSVVTFQYVFASEEYNEWVDKGFNDIFAAFFNGSTENRAVFGAAQTPASVDSINYHASRQLYVNNDPVDAPVRTTAYATEADGFTKVMTCTANVTPGVANTVRLVISDRGDSAWDSWALVKGGSFTSTGPITLAAVPTTGTSLPSTSNGYTVTLSNTGASSATVTSLQDLLPHGFTYTAGSSTGITTLNPTITTTPDGDQLLTWNGSFSLAAGSSNTLHFNVTTSSAYGNYYDNVSGVGTVAVVPTGDTALIKVRHAQEIAVTDPNGQAETSGSSTYDFGDWLTGAQTSARTFTITNEGATTNLTGIGVTLAGLNPTEYSVNTTGMSTTLAPGQSTKFTVKFKPTSSAFRSAILNIASSDTTKNPFKITLTGSGVTALTGSQLAYIKATNAQAGDAFGNVAISGNTIVVGASGEDSKASGVNGDQLDNTLNDAGAAYVYVRDPVTGAVTQEAYLKASNPGVTEGYGPVAISGDTIVVGAYLEDSNATGINAALTGGSGTQADNSATDSGAAYVYVRNPVTHKWSQQAYLKASNTDIWDYFGYSVAVDGDTIAVGAPAEASNATGVNGSQTNNLSQDSGAVYVYTRSGTTWTQQAYVKPNHVETEQFFGGAVALNNGTLAVGANGVASNKGDVEVYTRSGTTWTPQATLTASNGEANDGFGGSVAISGDTIVAGAVGEASNATGINAALTGGSGTQADNSAAYSGAAYVYTRSGTTWSQQAYLKASNTNTHDYFGSSVTISGDAIVVGAPEEQSNATGFNGNQTDNSVTNAGAAYVYIRSGTTWSQSGYIKASNTSYDAQYGLSVGLDGSSLIVGAGAERSNATGINAPAGPGSGTQADVSAPFTGAAFFYKIFQ